MLFQLFTNISTKTVDNMWKTVAIVNRFHKQIFKSKGEDPMKRLNEEQIVKELTQLSEWKRLDEKWITRRYRFKEFLDGIRFVNEIATYAEQKNHHPFISIDYKVVTLKISSWQMKGLTDLDFEMAKHFDDLYEQVIHSA